MLYFHKIDLLVLLLCVKEGTENVPAQTPNPIHTGRYAAIQGHHQAGNPRHPALLAKAVYNLVDTAYIGMLNSDIALTAVVVTVPLLLIMVSIENIFAAGAAVLAGRQLGAKNNEAARACSTFRSS